MSEKIGVYVCDCGGNISERVNLEELAQFAKTLPSVSYIKQQALLCSEEGKNFLNQDLQTENPTHIVIAACSPKEHELTFRKVCQRAGLNPYLFQMVNMREQVSWVISDPAEATRKAKKYLRAAIRRVLRHEPLEKKEIDCNTDALVIGAGPAGMEAALLLAKAGRKVSLVEKSPCIGGKPVRYENVFTKLECAACMFEPKMDEVLHHENIELSTYSEMQEVLGFLGNFIAKIKKKARYVDLEKCIGCGACYDPCPVKVKNKYDYNLSERKAIYTPFAGSLPNVPVIDKESCLRFKGEDCRLCQQACSFGAIKYDDQDQLIERKVGGVVIATGFDLFDPSVISEFGYGQVPEVYTSLEFERLLSSTGPTGGKIQMKNAQAPEFITIIHCVGSRTKKHHEYCSGVCCLYALKFSYLIKKALPEVHINHLYTDWCLPGKEAQSFFNTVADFKELDFVHTFAGDKIEIKEDRHKKIKVSYPVPHGRHHFLTDMVILCPAIVAGEDTGKIAHLFSLLQDKDSFLQEAHAKLAPVSTTIEGVYVAGCVQGPKNIQESITQSTGAAGQLLSCLVPGRRLELEPITAEINEKNCSGCKICITLCPYQAVVFDKEKKIALVNEVLCKGCGVCVSACPSGAIKGKHFSAEQIFEEIEGVLK